MSTTVFIAVIVAAVLHASWNALAKAGDDKLANMAAVVIGHAPLALAVLPFVPSPAPESWPYLIAGIAIHFGYQLLLLTSYRIGDLTQVYPIARGTAPLIVAAVSTMFLGVRLTPLELLGVLIIGAGILSLSLVRHEEGVRNVKAGALAFLTGVAIAGYSLVDGIGARIADTAIGFYSWLSLGNAAVFAAFAAVRRPDVFRKICGPARTTFLLGGSASWLAYALVIWSFTQAPIALVTALRETSIIFALLIGVWFLDEKLNLAKVTSTFFTLVGAALLRISKS